MSDKVIMYKDESGNIRSELISIIPDEDYRAKKSKKIEGKDFSGYIIVSNYENGSLIGAWLYKDGKDIKQVRLKDNSPNGRLRVCAETIVDVYEKSEPGGPNHVGGGGEEGVITIGDDVYVKTGSKSVLIGDCGGGAGDGFAGVGAVGGDGGSGGGGGVPSPYNPATLDDYDNFGRYIGSDPYYVLIQRISDLDQRGLGLSNDERQFLMSHNEFIDFMNQGLDNAGSSSIGPIEDALARINGRFTPEEKRTLGQGHWYYRLNMYIYIVNAIDATNLTGQYFAGKDPTCSACRANAFKHAMFIILNAKIFGADMAAQLGRDHEGGTQVNGPDREMDLNNNEVGISIYQNNSLSRISDFPNLIIIEMNTQHSRFIYLKNGVKVTADTP